MKAVRRIFVSVLIVIGGIVLCLCRPWESGMKGASAALEVFYNVKKADAVNSSTINVRKDGEVLAISTRQRPYMTQSMTLDSSCGYCSSFISWNGGSAGESYSALLRQWPRSDSLLRPIRL